MSSPRALTKWDPKVHEDILVAISDVLKLGREDWARVIQALHAMGYSFTESALKQHLQKLKRKEGDKKNEKDEDEQATPKKTKAATGRAKKTGGTPGTPSQKKRNRANVDLDEDEDEIKVKKLKFEPQAPNLGQYYEDEPYPPSDGEVV
ncbi:hypothetical protein EV127DRAFT_426071 [Xylaria flabelliformis]|nr:hypothetical protein EV127DRAFT_426071 [Xylaria flabelliformis]